MWFPILSGADGPHAARFTSYAQELAFERTAAVRVPGDSRLPVQYQLSVQLSVKMPISHGRYSISRMPLGSSTR